ncbi:hypothetical protein C8Q75DRAFT_770505 [Abortiporus biennis]|nr:hypothetical protein C8Q75DRAFT_770505 [Abortiporus biennis]
MPSFFGRSSHSSVTSSSTAYAYIKPHDFYVPQTKRLIQEGESSYDMASREFGRACEAQLLHDISMCDYQRRFEELSRKARRIRKEFIRQRYPLEDIYDYAYRFKDDAEVLRRVIHMSAYVGAQSQYERALNKTKHRGARLCKRPKYKVYDRYDRSSYGTSILPPYAEPQMNLDTLLRNSRSEHRPVLEEIPFETDDFNLWLDSFIQTSLYDISRSQCDHVRKLLTRALAYSESNDEALTSIASAFMQYTQWSFEQALEMAKQVVARYYGARY